MVSNRTILDKYVCLLMVIAVSTATSIGLASCVSNLKKNHTAPEIMDMKEYWEKRPYDFITLAQDTRNKINDAPGTISISEIRGKLGMENVKKLDDAKGTKRFIFIWSIGAVALNVWTDGTGEFALAAEMWFCCQ